MGQAIGESLALAIGVAICPMPIIAVVLLLTTPRAKTNGPLLLLGWLLGLGVIGVVVLTLAGREGASASGVPATWISWLKVALGVLLFVVALREFRSRPHGDQEPTMPRWMGTVAGVTPQGAVGLGAALAVVNPKNLILSVAGAAAIAQTGIPGVQQALAYLVFAVVASAGVATPLVIYFSMGSRAPVILEHVKEWMSRNNAVIMSVLCLLIGFKLVGDGIAGLTS